MTEKLPQLEADRAAYGEMPEEQLEALFEQVAQETVDRQPGPLDRLRELSTDVRVALALVVLSLAVLGVALGPWGRRDPDVLGWFRLVSGVVGLILLGGSGLRLSLRGPHRRPLGALGLASIGALLLAPLAFALVPGWWPGLGRFPLLWHEHCMRYSALMGGLVGGIGLVLQRTPPSWSRALAAGAAGGLLGLATLLLHCPYNEPGHLLMGHALPGLVLALVAVLVGSSPGRRAG